MEQCTTAHVDLGYKTWKCMEVMVTSLTKEVKNIQMDQTNQHISFRIYISRCDLGNNSQPCDNNYVRNITMAFIKTEA